MKPTRSALLILSAFVFCIVPSLAQTPQGEPPTSDLHKTIASLDASLFDAYNRCDLDKLAGYFAEDLEFYHDQTGLARGRQALLDAVKNNICGKVHRELVPGTLEVYPLKDYGAVEIGVHHFTHPGHPEDAGGDAKFIHLWQLKDGAWKITRVISFNHNSPSH